MVHQAELVVGKAVPGAIDLQRACGLAAVGVAQVQRDHAVAVGEFFQRVEGMFGQPGDGRIQAAARQHQQRKPAAGFFVMNAHGAVVEDRHGRTSLSRSLSCRR